MRILLRRVKPGLMPIDEISEQGLSKINIGEVVTVTVKKARNPKLQGLFWKTLHTVFENQERYKTIEELHDAIKVKAGAAKSLFLPDGTEFLVPASTSFDDMDDLQFRAYVHRAFDVIAQVFLLDVRNEAARLEIETMIGARAE